MNNNFLLECKNVSKAFGGTRALKNVDFNVLPGEVHALMGENGAGKSTLMKCVLGLYQCDEGDILFDGKLLKSKSPIEALDAGVSMIHQELNTMPNRTIAESIFLNREFTRGLILNKKKQNEETEKLLKNFEFPYPADTPMKRLTLAQAQIIEIINAVSANAKLIIMDEPTSSLDNEESERLFNIIEDLKQEGVAIIYISHRMEEIFRICDRVTVLRDGEYIDTANISDVSRDDLISMMVGRKVESIFPKVDCEIGDVALEVKNFTGDGFTDINFKVYEGEILGISGLVGSGRSETMRAIFGLDEFETGELILKGEKIVNRNTNEAIKNGICMVNEDRKNYGLALNRPITENISLPTLKYKQKNIFLNKKREEKENLEISNALNLKSSGIDKNANSLSGGNQQKVVLAKWLLANPKVLILDEPTRGVDVGAKAEIHAIICNLAAEGVAIIMVSSELPEIMGMSDRVLAYKEGTINGEFFRKDIVSGKVQDKDILSKSF